MANCENCGKEIFIENILCVDCIETNKHIEQNMNHCENVVFIEKETVNSDSTTLDSVEQNNDCRSIGWAIFSFIFAPIGAILYLFWFNEKPERSKSIGIGVSWGILVFQCYKLLLIYS